MRTSGRVDEPLGDDARVLLLRAHADRQRREPAVQEVGGERVQDRAGDRARAPQRGGDLRVARDDAADHVAVAAEVLGGAVQRDRGAEVERMLQHGRRERVVDEHGHVARRGDDRADVDELERRVRRRLEHDERGVGRGSTRRPRRACRTSPRRRGAPTPAGGRCRRRAGAPRRCAACRSRVRPRAAPPSSPPCRRRTRQPLRRARAAPAPLRSARRSGSTVARRRATRPRRGDRRSRGPRRRDRRRRCRGAGSSTRGRGGGRALRGPRDRRDRRARQGCLVAASSVPCRYGR